MGQALIKGHIHDSAKDKIMLFAPIQGFFNPNLPDKDSEISPNHSGYFEKNFSITRPQILRIQVGMESMDLLLEALDTIEIDIDGHNSLEKKNSPITVKGRNADGIELYNLFYPIGKKIDECKNLLNNMRYRDKYDINILNYVLTKMTWPFDSLLQTNRISKNFYRISVNDIKGILVSKIVEDLFFYQKKLELNQVLKIVDSLYYTYPVTEEMIRTGINGRELAENYFFSMARRFYPTYNLSDSIIFINDKKITIEQNLVLWLYAPFEVQEIEWAMSLINMKKFFPANFSDKDADAFLELHPNSPMKEYLKPPYFAKDQKREDQQDNFEIKFIDSSLYNNLSSLLISKFKGKKVLVDLWGTWCIPCKQEFTWNFQVDSFCRKNNIQRLYIAFELDAKNRIRDEARKNNLEGFNIVANKFLIKDITEKIYKNTQGNYAIPRFLLVNEKSEIVNADASRPSSGNQLFSEMKSAFKLAY